MSKNNLITIEALTDMKQGFADYREEIVSVLNNLEKATDNCCEAMRGDEISREYLKAIYESMKKLLLMLKDTESGEVYCKKLISKYEEIHSKH